MTRNRLVLLAAALVFLIGISVVVSARIYAVHPTSQTINAGPDKAVVAQLLARPLKFQHPTGTNNCPNGPYSPNGLLGGGPAYGVGGSLVNTGWGSYWSVGYQVDRGTGGPIVVRGQDLLLGWPLVFVGSYTTGPVYGTDLLNAKTEDQYTALVLDTSHPPTPSPNPAGTDWIWFVRQGFKHGWSGCVGFQVDGPGFSETFYSAGPGT